MNISSFVLPSVLQRHGPVMLVYKNWIGHWFSAVPSGHTWVSRPAAFFVCKILFQIELQNVSVLKEKFSYEVFISDKGLMNLEVVKFIFLITFHCMANLALEGIDFQACLGYYTFISLRKLMIWASTERFLKSSYQSFFDFLKGFMTIFMLPVFFSWK